MSMSLEAPSKDTELANVFRPYAAKEDGPIESSDDEYIAVGGDECKCMLGVCSVYAQHT